MIDIFIAYSHNDLPYKDELKKFLRPLLREGRISMWDDFDIEAGADWDAAIKQRLYGADLVLLLVSADSLASDYFYGKEVKVSLERHERGEAVVVPVVLRHCDWTETPLGTLEALPEKGRPVADWPTRDQAMQDIVSRLRRVVEGVERKKKAGAAQADALRHFQAACLAADQLFQKKNWAEARAAYAAALAAHQPGFAPDRAALQAKMADCDAGLRAEKAEQEAAAQRAKEAEAQQAREQQRAEKERLAQEKRQRQLSETSEQSRSSISGSTSPTARLLMGIGAGAALVLVLLLWQPWRSADDNPQPQAPQPAAQPDTAAADFAIAKAAGTLPALRGFLEKKYASLRDKDEAKQLIANLETRVNRLIEDAERFPEDPATACSLLKQALEIDSSNQIALQKREKLKCHRIELKEAMKIMN